MTALTPSSFGPFAAQSREEPVAVLLPGQDDQRHPLRAVALRCVEDRHLLARRAGAPSSPFRAGDEQVASRTFANVPRIITSWLPRREPKRVESSRSTPCSIRYCAGRASLGGSTRPGRCGRSSPSRRRRRGSARPRCPSTGAGSGSCPSKYGGSLHVGRVGSHSKRSPSGRAARASRRRPRRHWRTGAEHLLRRSRSRSCSATSAGRRPDVGEEHVLSVGARPSGSVSRSMSIVPASA